MARPGPGWKGETTRGGRGGKEREGTGRSTPERHQHHARAGPRWRRDLDGGGSGRRGRAFSPGAERHPDHSSPHTLLTLPRTSTDQQQSPPSTPLPQEAEAKAEAAASTSLSALDHAPPPSLSREMTPADGRSRRASRVPSPWESRCGPL